MDKPKKGQQPLAGFTIDQDPLILSAYNSPLPELQEVHQLCQETILQQALQLGYDPASMIMHPVNQITDLDSNNNVKVLTYSNVWGVGQPQIRRVIRKGPRSRGLPEAVYGVKVLDSPLSEWPWNSRNRRTILTG
jgi:hypothetical protein